MQMRKQHNISDQAFGVLADMIGGQALTFVNTSQVPALRKMTYRLDGKEVSRDIVMELAGIEAIRPAFLDLDNVPIHVTDAGFKYVRNLADA
jgi:hypothetical protein